MSMTLTDLDAAIWAALSPLGWLRSVEPRWWLRSVQSQPDWYQYDPPGPGDGCIYLQSDAWFEIKFPASEVALHAEGIAAAIAAVAGVGK